MNEMELIEKKDLRDEYINKIEVLEKVKQLLLLPDINLATTQQVADFYEVGIEAIKSIISRNREELNSDGFVVWKSKDFRSCNMNLLKIDNCSGGFNIKFSNDETIKSSNKGLSLFTRRSILRTGMLLRDSNIAKEVRTQLLNIEEKATVSQKTDAITEEQKLVLNIIYAKDDIERANATGILLSYKNKQIDSLENKVEALVEGNLTWEPREGINRMVRLIGYNVFRNNFTRAWEKVYAEMLYKHNISISHRKLNSKLKKPTAFDVLNEEEIRLLVQSCLSLCEMYNINTNDLMIKQVG
ncbi:MAG: hypothetical protein PHX40_05015 [Bacilli bacterium]|nr:hypothetical protein [Bacilli bacterium]